jgi:hypothetical protein
VVEGSVDGVSWVEMDRRTDTSAFKCVWETASFVVSNPAECRFIRLTQTAKDHENKDDIALRAVEFFGVLSE